MSSRSVRTGVIVGLAVVALVAGVAVLAARSSASPTSPASPAPPASLAPSDPRTGAPSGSAKEAPPAAAKTRQNSCSACLERNPLVDPARYASWNDTDVRKAYEAAVKYPATIDLLHCFCECQESPREQHKTLLTCFTSQHAAGCGICQHEAIMAARLKDEGASDEQVEATVESLHRTEGHKMTKGRGI